MTMTTETIEEKANFDTECDVIAEEAQRKAHYTVLVKRDGVALIDESVEDLVFSETFEGPQDGMARYAHEIKFSKKRQVSEKGLAKLCDWLVSQSESLQPGDVVPRPCRCPAKAERSTP